MGLSTKRKREILVIGIQTILIAGMWFAMYFISGEPLIIIGLSITIAILWISDRFIFKEDSNEDAKSQIPNRKSQIVNRKSQIVNKKL